MGTNRPPVDFSNRAKPPKDERRAIDPLVSMRLGMAAFAGLRGHAEFQKQPVVQKSPLYRPPPSPERRWGQR
jgi:hypothetical protein